MNFIILFNSIIIISQLKKNTSLQDYNLRTILHEDSDFTSNFLL